MLNWLRRKDLNLWWASIAIGALTSLIPSNSVMAAGTPGTIVHATVYEGGDNLLKNANFQASSPSSGWTLGTGVTTLASTNPKFGTDPQTLVLNIGTVPGAEDLIYQDVAVSNGAIVGMNIEQSFYVLNSTFTTIQVCARLNGADVAGSCVAVPSSGTWVYTPSAGSVGPSAATSVGVSLYTTAAISLGTINITHGYVGRNRNLSNATPITAWQTYTATLSAGFGTATSVAEYRQVGSDMEIKVKVASGTLAASVGAISLPSGYTIDTNGLTIKTNDTTADGDNIGHWTSDTGVGTANMGGMVTCPATSTSNIYIGGAASGAGSSNKAINMVNFSNTAIFTILAKVPVVQFASSVPIASLANVAQSWSGHHNGSCSFNVTSTTYADMTNSNSSCALVQDSNNNFGAVSSAGGSGASALPGIVFTPNKPGAYYVCVTGSVYNSVSNDNSQLRLWDGTNLLSEVDSRDTANNSKPATLCGIYTAASATSATIKIQGAATSGSTASLDSSGVLAKNTLYWQIFPISQNFPQPYATGNVSSTTQGMEHVERAYVACHTGTCSISNQSGNWISSMSRSSAGQYTVNSPSGEWSGLPTCVCSAYNGGRTCSAQQSSSTAQLIYTFAPTSPAYEDNDFTIICMGPH